MDCGSFREHVLSHIDGELAGDAAAGAAAHESACADCGRLAAAERAFEHRTRSALLAAVPGGTFESLLAAARVRAEGERVAGRAARVVPLRRAARAIASLAAVALVAVTAMWSLCIPPFECGYLQALEAVAVQPSGTDLATAAAGGGVPARFVPPERLRGFERVDDPDAVRVQYRDGARAVRAAYARGGERFTVVWSDLLGCTPSFRRRVERDGLDWWIADENGRTVVAFICSKTKTLCALVGDLPEERLREIAVGMRCP